MKDKRASGSGLHSLLRLLPYAKPYSWSFLLVLGLVIVFNATSVLQPWLVKIAIDRDIAAKNPNPHGLLVVSAVYVGMVILGVVANYVQLIVLQYTGQSIIRWIRLDLFKHIESQAMSFFDKNAIGRLVTNVSSDTETVNQFFTGFFLSLVRDGLSIVMIVIAMFELNGRIAAYCMLILPIIFAVSLVFRARLRAAYQTTRTRLSNIVAFLAENLAGIRIIQIFRQEKRQLDHFSKLNTSHRQANVSEYGISVLFNRVLELLGNVAVAAVVWIGGGAVLHRVILFGTLYAFISYIQRFFQPINSVTQQWNTLQSAMVAADRIGTVLNIVPAIQDAKQPVDASRLKEIAGKIDFSHVWFSYVADEPVLRDISFSVEPGEFVGFVGATGAGKSSVMSLLTRFYEPDEGVIALDGIDIKEIAQTDLHRLIGLVQQDVYLFSGSILDNIRLFRQEISRQDAVSAAKTVGAHEIIERMPHGYDTHIVAKGANLSMGERQLISFARIVALNPRVLILDEATASLDSQTEELVQTGLSAVAANRTTLVIAHRLSTIRHANRIFVLDRGQIVEQGSHDELVRLGGLYADLHVKSGIEYEKSQTGTP
ncbi:ABC transporter ATP-binding protein/permease [Alicyclobacillus tolerans]|uniref:ABC transporter ATP-binding protein n=1 Tax=Alicyclobacillus tolerans TaxID=90970 RepID=UPI001F3C50C7|nr:ABC transporter ATP-binding protein [Alicyclobacillus tolerans]MCF8567228.1 ABC transporter ATP-binding protein/permease [Alicyclobacillus tolerans]